MRVKYPQADGRGIVPRKWSVGKTGGPLVFFCELVLKRMIQHGFPAGYVVLPTNREFPTVAVFTSELEVTPRFLEVLHVLVRQLARKWCITVDVLDQSVELLGDWRLVLRFNPAKPGAVVGAKFERLTFADPPF